MDRDIRETPIYKELEDHFRRALEPAFGKISGASGATASPDGKRVAFTGTRREKLEGSPQSRVCLVESQGGTVSEITSGPNDDRSPAWSPDGTKLAFASDRASKGQFQLYILESGRLGEAVPCEPLDGLTVEYLIWSPDGTRVLVGTVGLGAEQAGAQGSGKTKATQEDLPSWVPSVDNGPSVHDRRRLHVYDVATKKTQALSPDGPNVWEAAWAGDDRVWAVVSAEPTEDAWYSASLALLDVDKGGWTDRYSGEWQLGLPAGSPDGRYLAGVEGLASDRGVVAGDLLLFEASGGDPVRVDTGAVDVTCLSWRDANHLIFAGTRGLDAVVGEFTASTGTVREQWSFAGSTGGFHPSVSPLRDGGVVTVVERYGEHPEVAIVRNGGVEKLTSLCHDGSSYLESLAGTLARVSWEAPDGLEIEGLLLTPQGPGPYPLVVSIHGGPVSSWASRWLAPGYTTWLVSHGYAFFYPNPRGSSGRGQAFSRMVYGDPGGAETLDTLSGIDMLVAKGIVDPRRLGVIGGSHGGFMTSWIITQTDRFAAAVSISPVTDWYSQHHTSNIGQFDSRFLQDDVRNPGGLYLQRSPALQASTVVTPTLTTAGAVDRCTPPGQAREFHQALLEHGVESSLVIYPEEGHGVRGMPAFIDSSARIVDWFERHMKNLDGDEIVEDTLRTETQPVDI